MIDNGRLKQVRDNKRIATEKDICVDYLFLPPASFIAIQLCLHFLSTFPLDTVWP